MTSTNFTSGLGDNSKLSSKVLRPPGGGSSDIFGTDAPATPRTIRNHMASNIFGSSQDCILKNSGDNGRRVQKTTDSYSRLFGEPDRPFASAKNHMKSSIPFGSKNDGGNKPVINGSTEITNGHSTKTATKIENGVEPQNGFSKTGQDELASSETNNDDIQNNNDTLNINNEANIDANLNDSSENNKVELDGNYVDSTTTSSVTTSSSVSPISSENTNKTSPLRSPRARNPVTGDGFEVNDKARRNTSRRDGNPVTGEGYRPAPPEVSTTVPSLNGTNQVINKNRIPPGGFSSGLCSSALNQTPGQDELASSETNNDDIQNNNDTLNINNEANIDANLNDSSENNKVELDGNYVDSTTTSSVTTSSSVSPISSENTNKTSPLRSPRARNTVTGDGFEVNDKARRNTSRRDGNPVTGEGYRPAPPEVSTTVPSLNGTNQVINKNRIPPVGFSSGLW